jgi:uncharacterized protein
MNKELISKIADDVRARMAGDSSHDWWHVFRVWKMAQRLVVDEKVERSLVVELGALLHDISDWKFQDGDETVGPRLAREILETHGVDASTIEEVCDIVATISYKGAGVATPMKTHAGQIVQDADRLDAIGAIGIARCFAYGGHKNRVMYDPEDLPVLHVDKEAYKNNKGTSVNHFYEKLLLLKDRMNTASAKNIAEDRHWFMETYLDEFYGEWDGKR